MRRAFLVIAALPLALAGCNGNGDATSPSTSTSSSTSSTTSHTTSSSSAQASPSTAATPTTAMEMASPTAVPEQTANPPEAAQPTPDVEQTAVNDGAGEAVNPATVPFANGGTCAAAECGYGTDDNGNPNPSSGELQTLYGCEEGYITDAALCEAVRAKAEQYGW